MKPMFQELFYNQQKFPKGWSPLSDHSNIPISTQVIRIHLRLFWLLGITWQTGPTFQEHFYDQKKFPKCWSPLSNHSKIPFTTQVIRIHLCLLWLLGITCQMGPTFQEHFYDQKKVCRLFNLSRQNMKKMVTIYSS